MTMTDRPAAWRRPHGLRRSARVFTPILSAARDAGTTRLALRRRLARLRRWRRSTRQPAGGYYTRARCTDRRQRRPRRQGRYGLFPEQRLAMACDHHAQANRPAGEPAQTVIDFAPATLLDTRTRPIGMSGSAPWNCGAKRTRVVSQMHQAIMKPFPDEDELKLIAALLRGQRHLPSEQAPSERWRCCYMACFAFYRLIQI